MISPQIAGIVVGAINSISNQSKPPLTNKPVNKSAVVLDVHPRTEVPVVSCQRAEAMGTRVNNPLYPVPIEEFNVLVRFHLVEVVITELSWWFTATGFLLTLHTLLCEDG